MNVEPLEPAYSFPHLGRTIAYKNRNWVAVYHNLSKAQQRRGVIFKVLSKTGSMVQSSGILYKAVVQTVLLYGSESWGATEAMLKVLEGFHHRESRRIVVMMAWHAEDREWE